jgi:hypothetical protein
MHDAACAHDWRLNRTREDTQYTLAPDPQRTSAIIAPTVFVTKYDEWYCTKCRLIEERIRV